MLKNMVGFVCAYNLTLTINDVFILLRLTNIFLGFVPKLNFHWLIFIIIISPINIECIRIITIKIFYDKCSFEIFVANITSRNMYTINRFNLREYQLVTSSGIFNKFSFTNGNTHIFSPESLRFITIYIIHTCWTFCWATLYWEWLTIQYYNLTNIIF